MTASETTFRELQGRTISSGTVQMLNPKLFVLAYLGETCKANAADLRLGKQKEDRWTACKESLVILSSPWASGPCFSRGGQLTAQESQEGAQPASCLLLFPGGEGLCSAGDASLHFHGLLLPSNGQRAENPFAGDHGVTGSGDWCQRVPLCSQTCEVPSRLQLQAGSRLPSAALGMGPGSPPALPAAPIAGFYPPCFLFHLPRKVPVSWWLGGKVTAERGKERQCRQIGKSAQISASSVSQRHLLPAPLTEALHR